MVYRPSYIKHVCDFRYFLYLLRRKENAKGFGSCIYYYQIKNKEEVKKRIMGTIKNWVSKVESEMKEWK